MPSLSFKALPKKRVLVFEADPFLDKAVLYGIDCFVLPSKQERVFFNPKVLRQFFRNFRWVRPLSIGSPGRRLRHLFGELTRVYLLSCIECVNPEVVVTTVDNSYDFQWCSRRFRHSNFFAIQNGTRLPSYISRPVTDPEAPDSRISMPHFFCFGTLQETLYKKCGHDIDRFTPVGSIRGDWYRMNADAWPQENRFDLCLVSQYNHSIMTDDRDPRYPGLRDAVNRLSDFLKRYVDAHDVSLCIPMCSRMTEERQYFRSIFGDRATIVVNDTEKMSTYGTMAESRVLLGVTSTAAYEGFGWGSRVLFCNLSDNRDFDLPVERFYAMGKGDYPVFERKLRYLLNMDECEYQAKAGDDRALLMNYRRDLPTPLFIRKALLEHIVMAA